MADMDTERARLRDLTLRFTGAFNRDDLEAVMSFFTENAVYDEFNGQRRVGKAEIRAVFAPQFEGAYGKVRFAREDLFIDPEARKALISWTCTMRNERGPGAWRGLDILHFSGDLITAKHTYAKAKSLRITAPGA